MHTADRQSKLANGFTVSAGVLLALTAMAKLVSAFGPAKILQRHDPILHLQYNRLFLVAAAMELLVAGLCFSRQTLRAKAGAVAWLASLFLVYRLGRWWAHYPDPCSCLGKVTDALHISPETADDIAKVLLAYLLAGSYAILIWTGRRKPGDGSAAFSGGASALGQK